MRVLWIVTAAAAGLLLGSVTPTRAETPKYQPTRIDFPVKGLDDLELAGAITTKLYKLPAVLGVIGQVGKVAVGVRPDKTLKASEVAAAVKAASTEHLQFELDWAAIPLAGKCGLTLADVGERKDEEIAQALQAAPNVEKATGSGAKWTVTFKAPPGATVGEVDAALQAAFPAAEGQPAVPKVADVSWLGPKAPAGWKEGSHGSK